MSKELPDLLQPEEGESVVIGGKKYRIVSFPDSFFRATRKASKKLFGEVNGHGQPTSTDPGQQNGQSDKQPLNDTDD